MRWILFIISLFLTHIIDALQDYQVVEANISEAKEICEVVNEAYTRDYFRNKERPRTSYEKILNYFLDGEHTWYVIKHTNEDKTEIVCAVLYSTDRALETPTEGNIHMLSARKAYWGKKISLSLLEKIEERAIRDKKSTVRLIVVNTNPGLIKLYESLGYHMTGETFEFPSTSVATQYQQKDADGHSMIFCLHMEKELPNRS